MDRLVVLEQGRIVEQGTHAALLRRGGLYAELWRRQSGGFLGARRGRVASSKRGDGLRAPNRPPHFDRRGLRAAGKNVKKPHG